MTDCPRAAEVSHLVDGELDQTAGDSIREHLAYCEPCQNYLEWYAALMTRLDSLPRFESNSDWQTEVWREVERPSWWRRAWKWVWRGP